MTRRSHAHTHPCDECRAKVPCAGELSRNYDGWPEVICDDFHWPGGENRPTLCDACEDRAIDALMCGYCGLTNEYCPCDIDTE